MYKLIDNKVSLRFSTSGTPVIALGVTVSDDDKSYALTIDGSNPSSVFGPLNVKAIAVVNENATFCNIKIEYVNQGNTKVLIDISMSAGDQLTYESGYGWKVIDNTGAIRGVGAAGPAGSATISAGTESYALGMVVFSNSNDITFGLSGSVVTASFSNTNAGGGSINVSAGTTSNNLSALVFSNSNGVSFGINGSTVTATVKTDYQSSGAYLTTAMQSNAVTISNINVSAGTTSNNLSALTFNNANGVSFGINGSVVTGSVAAQSIDTDKAGTGFTSAGTNISFSGTLNTNGLSLQASVNAQSDVGFSASNGSQTFQTLNFVEGGGVTFSTNTNGINATVKTDYQSSGNYLTTAMLSNAVTLSNIKLSAGTLSALRSDITFNNSNGVSFGLETNGVVTATVATNYQSAGAYLTTAMASNRGSDFVQATAAFNGTNASGTIASDGISVSIAPQSAQPVGASASNGSFLFSTLKFVETNGVTWATSTDGIRASVQTNYQSTGNYLTTAMASNRGSDFMGTNTAITNNGVSMTANSSGLSLNFPAFLTTAQSPGAYLTTAAQSNQVVNSINGSTGIFTFNTGSSLSSSRNGNSITFGLASDITTALQSAGAYLTTARRSTDAIGLNTARSNVTWTVNSDGISFDARGYAGTQTSATNAGLTVDSNGVSLNVTREFYKAWELEGANTAGTTGSTLTTTGVLYFSGGNGITLSGNSNTIVISGANAGTGAGSFSAGMSNTGSTAGTSGLVGGQIVFAGTNGILLSQSVNGASATLTINGQQTKYLSYFANVALNGMGTGASGITQSSGQAIYVQPFTLPQNLSANYLRFFISMVDNAQGTAGTPAANATFSCDNYTTWAIVLYSQGVGASSRSLQSMSSTSAGMTGRTIFQAGAQSSQYTITLQKTYPGLGFTTNSYTTSYAVSSGSIVISSNSNTLFTGARYLDIPWLSSIPWGNYWLGIGGSSSSNTNSSNISFCGVNTIANTLNAITQTALTFAPVGVVSSLFGNQVTFGHGAYSTNASTISFASIDMNSVSIKASLPIVPFQFIRQA
jgi:hypothetical protein